MNYYEILEVSVNASKEVIKNAYRALIKKYHPDSYTGNKEFAQEKMKKINEAYETLIDDKKRLLYDYDNGFKIDPNAPKEEGENDLDVKENTEINNEKKNNTNKENIISLFKNKKIIAIAIILLFILAFIIGSIIAGNDESNKEENEDNDTPNTTYTIDKNTEKNNDTYIPKYNPNTQINDNIENEKTNEDQKQGENDIEKDVPSKDEPDIDNEENNGIS